MAVHEGALDAERVLCGQLRDERGHGGAIEAAVRRVDFLGECHHFDWHLRLFRALQAASEHLFRGLETQVQRLAGGSLSK